MVKGHPGEVLLRNEEHYWTMEKKVILVRKWQRIWLKCALVFCGM